MNFAGPIYVPPPVIVTNDDNCTHNCNGTASDNWTFMLIAVAVAAVGLAVAWYMRRLARISSDSNDDLDWPDWMAAVMILALSAAGIGVILAFVAWVILLVNGWVTAWTLLIPIGALAYGVRRGERYIAAKRAAP